MQPIQKVVVGLGNPGLEFKNTYHNAGVLALEEISKELEKNGVAVEFKTHKNLFRYVLAGGLAFVIPLTFMNDSGGAVKEAMKKFKVLAKNIVVIHDESDLTVGNYKISSGRGAAGHKGVQSIIDALHSNDFTRIRIGVRQKNETQRKKASAFVLKKISKGDGVALADVFEKILKGLR